MSAEDESEPKRIRQCKSCPWRIDCVPEEDIPGGYRVDLHENLACTIKSGLDSLPRGAIRAMACHHSRPGEEFVCAGWLHNQLGPGNNIGARLAVMTGKWPVPDVDGEQHERFEDTLPKPKRASRSARRRLRPSRPRSRRR